MSHQFLSESWIEAARDIRHRYSGDVPAIDVVVRINVITTTHHEDEPATDEHGRTFSEVLIHPFVEQYADEDGEPIMENLRALAARPQNCWAAMPAFIASPATSFMAAAAMP